MSELQPSERSQRIGVGLVSRDGQYLVRQRPPDGPLAGLWEFPGGKCEAGESPEAATVRECHEELGVTVVLGSLRRSVTHRYPHGLLELFFFDCSIADRLIEPDPEKGFRWVAAEALPFLTFPEANLPVLQELARGSVATQRA
jgi:mutator protein MutT